MGERGTEQNYYPEKDRPEENQSGSEAKEKGTIKFEVNFDNLAVSLPYEVLGEIDFRRSDDGYYDRVTVGGKEYPVTKWHGGYQISISGVSELDDVILNLSDFVEIDWDSYGDAVGDFAEIERSNAKQLALGSPEERLELRAPHPSIIEDLSVSNTFVETNFSKRVERLRAILQSDDRERQKKDFYSRPRWELYLEVLDSAEKSGGQFGQHEYNTVARLSEKAGLI